MTRVLAELLAQSGPSFQLNLRQLEAGAGMPSHDIRLTAGIVQGMQAKLRELGLDPHDTQPHELHAVLRAKLEEQELSFAKSLKGKSTKTGDPIAHVALALKKALVPKSCFALKSTVAKRLLKANVPKKTMKALGYRSADSMLKHESPACLYAAAEMIEADAWTKKQHTAYAKLKASDFEIRDLSIEHPTSKRWQSLAETVVARHRHNIFSFKELGAIVLLPLPVSHPELPTLTAAVLTLHAANDILAASTYLRLHQVHTHFGTVVKQVVASEPVLDTQLFDQAVSWNMVQRYFTRFKDTMRSDIFEPVIQAEEVVWHDVEQVLARLDPHLKFWEGTSHFGMLSPGGVVSCSLTDQVLSHCNNLPFEQRLLRNFRQAIMAELSLRYMTAERVEQAIASKFQKQLVLEPVTV
ncbi:MAG: hypothetical protein JWP13_727 [Candidatus Saccharibacteria bacterium]|nr:hypothetical protein [Candidatus Saccharibacteria bacterium]